MSEDLLRTMAGGIRAFYCPGCHCSHGVDARWTVTGTPDKPTIRPSVHHQTAPRCHLFVTEGTIQFLNDCDHELAGKTVPMEEM